MINRRHDGRASCLARQSLEQTLARKPQIHAPAASADRAERRHIRADRGFWSLLGEIAARGDCGIQHSSGFRWPRNQVRNRLSPGGNEIRTLGPSLGLLRHIRMKPLANNRVEVRLRFSEPSKIPGKGAGDRLASVRLVKREGRRRVDLEAENFSGGRDFEVDPREG
jgi:hypothetical protein